MSSAPPIQLTFLPATVTWNFWSDFQLHFSCRERLACLQDNGFLLTQNAHLSLSNKKKLCVVKWLWGILWIQCSHLRRIIFSVLECWFSQLFIIYKDYNESLLLCYQNLIILYYSLYSDDSDQSYKIKDECQNITVLYCDLTAETPFVYDVSYHAKVLVNGRAHGSTETRFKPSEHSKNTHTQSYISLHLIVRTIISQYSSIHLFFPPSSSFLHSYFGSTHLVYIHNRVVSVC